MIDYLSAGTEPVRSHIVSSQPSVLAVAEAFVAELKEDKDKVHIINKMTDNNGDNNFVVSYNEFHESMYAAG